MKPHWKTAALLSTGSALILSALAISAAAPGEPAAPARPGPSVSPPPAPLGVAAPSSAPLPAATDSDSVTLQTALSQGAIARGRSGEIFVRAVVRAREHKSAARSAVQLALALDVSGSMAGDKIAHARAAALKLIDALSDEDRLAIVAYDSLPRVEVQLCQASEDNKRRLRAAVERLGPGSGTNLSGGLVLASQELASARSSATLPRVVLISDGLANEGITARPDLAKLAGELRGKGMTLSTIGVGVDFDHDLMATLAEVGSGQYHYLREPQELATLLDRELSMAARLVAGNNVLTLALPPGAQVLNVYGYRSEVRDGLLAVPLPDLSSGAAIQVVARVKLPESAQGSSIAARLAFHDFLRDGVPQVAGAADLAMRVVETEAEARASLDKEVMLQAAKLQSALELARAADLYEQGRREEANRLVEATSANTAAAAKTYDLASLNPWSSNLRSLFAASANALGGSADANVRHEIKQAKRTLGNFNALNSGEK